MLAGNAMALMRRALGLLGAAVTALALCGAFAAPALADEGPRLLYEPGEVVVVYKAPSSTGLSTMSAVSAMMSSASAFAQYSVESAEVVDSSLGEDGSVVKLSLASDDDVDALIAALSSNEMVAYAQRNFRYYLMDEDWTDADAAAYAAATAGLSARGLEAQDGPATDDPSLSDQYYLHGWTDSLSTNSGANVVAAWDKVIGEYDAGGKIDVTIAILDTGIRSTHEDLTAVIDKEHMKDVYNNTAAGQITDYVGHGTHVAGIAGAATNNGTGIAGASYGATILPIKVFNNESGDDSYTDSVYLLRAYEYLDGLIENGELENLHVINMSLGGYAALDSADYALESAISEMRDDNLVLTVCSGGNGDSYGNPYTISCYPSDFDEVLSVTALTKLGTNTSWSDYNRYKDISAPGEALYSTYNSSNSSYTEMSGTSMAAPLVSGIAALLWAVNPDLEVEQAVDAITSTAHKLDASGANYHATSGSAGAIDAAGAVQYVLDEYPAGTSRISIRNADVQTVEYVMYDGTAHTPEVSVTCEGQPLVQGADYTLEYVDNRDVGRAKAVVTGINGFRGTKTVRFYICNDLSDSNRFSAWAITARKYTGNAISPLPQAYYDGGMLTKGVDYTVSYFNNIYGSQATVTLTGMGTYRGTQTLTFDVIGSPVDTSALLAAIDSVEELRAETVVAEGEAGLSSGTRWTDEGNDAVFAEAIEQARAVLGMRKQTQASLRSAVAALLDAQEEYLGKCQTVAVDISAAKVTAPDQVYQGGDELTPAVTVVLGDATLAQGDDYTVEYSSNREVGTAAVTVTGAGSYAGTATGTFKIAKARIASVTLSQDSFTYDGSAKNPDVTVKGSNGLVLSSDDYRLSVPSGRTSPGTYAYTATGTGNYEGAASATLTVAAGTVTVYRLYDPRTGEHHYTTAEAEQTQCLAVGWNDEGIAWYSPSISDTPVYRLYNRVTGEHFYTTSKAERAQCLEGDWNDEGIGWYSDDARTAPVYRLHNEAAAPFAHHYTASLAERARCLNEWDWEAEGISWYALEVA